MSRIDWSQFGDSLDTVERLMVIEELIQTDGRSSLTQKQLLIAELEERYGRGELGDDWDMDEELGFAVKKPNPRKPLGTAGATVDFGSEPLTDDPLGGLN